MTDETPRIRAVHDLAKTFNVDVGGDALSIVHELRTLMRPMVDEGSSMDSGGGLGSSDMWFTIGGVEYTMQVTPRRRVAPQ